MSLARPRCRVALFVSLMMIGWAGAAAAQTETIEYYATDAVGSVRVVFDASGNVLGRMDYEPFGRELFSGVFPITEHFSGQQVDGESGQGYFHARQYAKLTGRFSRVDPIYAGLFVPQRWNRYTYVTNNPVSFIDPRGLDPCCPGSHSDFCSGIVQDLPDDHDFWGGFSFMPPVYGEVPLNGWLARHEARYAERQAARAARGTGDDGPSNAPPSPPPPAPAGPSPDPPNPTETVPTWLSCFAQNYDFATMAANQSIFDLAGALTGFDALTLANKVPLVPKTIGQAVSAAGGLKGKAAEFFGLVTPTQALKSFLTNGGWTGAVLSPTGTLFSAGVNFGVSAGASYIAYEAGVRVGAASYAAGQAFARWNCK